MSDQTVEEPKIESTEEVEKTAEEVQAEKFYGKPEEEAQAPEKEQEDSPEVQDETKDSDEQEETADETKPQELELELSKDSPLDQSYVDGVLKFAKENDLSQEEAQNILQDKEDAVTDFIKDQNEAIEAKAKEGRETIAKDPIMGLDKFEESQAIARSILTDRRFVPEEDEEALTQALDNARALDNPIIFRMLYKIGKAAQDDKYLKATDPVTKKKSMAERWYGDQAKE